MLHRLCATDRSGRQPNEFISSFGVLYTSSVTAVADYLVLDSLSIHHLSFLACFLLHVCYDATHSVLNDAIIQNCPITITEWSNVGVNI